MNQPPAAPLPAITYPVSYEITRPEGYNRLTVAFRLILAIPQLILVGGTGLFGVWFTRGPSSGRLFGPMLNGGLLGILLAILTLFAWCAIVFTGSYAGAGRDFCLMIFRWQQNVIAYLYLLAAPYPPFGDKPYALHLVVEPPEERKRLTVAFRIFLVIPHAIILVFLTIAAQIVTLIAWFAILFTGQYPAAFYEFSVGVARWSARVSAYMLLFVDEYPPFTMESTTALGPTDPRMV